MVGVFASRSLARRRILMLFAHTHAPTREAALVYGAVAAPSNRWGVLVVDKTRTRPLAAIHGSGLGVNAEMRQEGLWGLL
jgi:hypothetical protein